MNFPSALPLLETARLRLRSFRPGDAADVQRLAGATEVADTTTRLPHPYPDGAAECWIATHESLWRERRELILAVTRAAQGEFLGTVSLAFDVPNEKAELGYWIGVPYWRNGFATEAAGALVHFGFRTIGLQRVQAHHFARNPASGRVMLKLGLRREEVRLQALQKNGRFEDLVFYGMRQCDWPPCRDARSALSPSDA